MPRLRKIEIENFGGIREFSWVPSAGSNCLIGPGDSGKSTVLDAIDLCLGARRTAQFTDAGFHNLDVTKPIRIFLTIGELDDALKTMEGYLTRRVARLWPGLRSFGVARLLGELRERTRDLEEALEYQTATSDVLIKDTVQGTAEK